MKKLKIGLIGCGGIANQKHLPSLKANSDKCELVAFCDIIRERAEKLGKSVLNTNGCQAGPGGGCTPC